MTCWLYQMSVKFYSQERYRNEIWEGNVIQNWTIGESKHKPDDVMPGDMIILFYTKTGTNDPGIYGWGIVTFFDKEAGELHFRPAPPSDYLKMNPLPENQISAIIDKIRDLPQGTIWKVDDDLVKDIRQKIAEHVFGVS